MILTVTINPLLEHRFTFPELSPVKQNRDARLGYAAGGKGINVSRQLNKLGVKNYALTLAGGINGKLFRKAIKEEGINFSIISTSSETRICAVVIDSSANNVNYYFSENQQITKSEVENFLQKLEKMIQNSEIVIFSGSSPCKETDIIFPGGIEMANNYGKISFCDTYGEHLQDCYSASPTVIHNNIDEVKSSIKVELNTEKEKLNFLDSLYSKGIKQAFLTNGADNIYASNFDFHFKINTPKINAVDSTGSGDSFVAGIAYGWHNNLVFNDQVRLATALGAKNATTFDVSNSEYKDASNIVDDIEIIPIGKKLNLIDDKPN